jgi:hypothetical protein
VSESCRCHNPSSIMNNTFSVDFHHISGVIRRSYYEKPIFVSRVWAIVSLNGGGGLQWHESHASLYKTLSLFCTLALQFDLLPQNPLLALPSGSRCTIICQPCLLSLFPFRPPLFQRPTAHAENLVLKRVFIAAESVLLRIQVNVCHLPNVIIEPACFRNSFAIRRLTAFKMPIFPLYPQTILPSATVPNRKISQTGMTLSLGSPKLSPGARSFAEHPRLSEMAGQPLKVPKHLRNPQIALVIQQPLLLHHPILSEFLCRRKRTPM